MSVQDQFDTSTAAGRLGLNLLTSVAQWEREAIGERTSTALRQKQSAGEHVGRVSFGFRMDQPGGHLVPAECEYETLRLAVELRKGGMTLQAIAGELNARGVRTRSGAVWYPAGVRNLLLRSERQPA